MKILHVNKFYFPIIGGVETVTRNIADGLQRFGIENEVLACTLRGGGGTSKVNGIEFNYAKTIGVFMSMPISFQFFRLFRERYNQCDALFLHHPFPLAFLAYFLYGKNKPLYVWYHSDIVRQSITGALIRPLISAVLKDANKIFVSSAHLIQNSSILAEVKDRCVVIPFGINVDDYKKTADMEKQIESIRSTRKKTILLAVGRLVYYKGFEYLIEAMKGVDAELLIVGEGAYKDSLLRVAEKHGVQKKISFISNVPSLVPYYHACDIFVFPSIVPSETFGIVQVEAMACKKPVINTNVHSGVSSVSVHGKTGITVPMKDAVALRSAIQKMQSDKHLREFFGKNGVERVSDCYTMESFVERLVTEIKGI